MRPIARVPTVVAALLAAVAGVLALAQPVAAAVAQPDGARGRVVVVGVPGLRWSDVSPTTTPTLWNLVGRASAGSLSVRTADSRTCPSEGWLAVSSGQRTALPGDSCQPPPEPVQAGSDTSGGVAVPGYGRMRRANAGTGYAAQVGLLGDTLNAAGACVTAVGPGAALAAADSRGHVGSYAPGPAAAGRADYTRCPLTIVSIDALARTYHAGAQQEQEDAVSAAQRRAALRRADARVARVLRDTPAGTTVLVAGISGVTPTAHLHTALALGPAPLGERYGGTYLTSASTRRGGLVTLTDITVTVLRALGADGRGPAVGAPWRAGGSLPAQPDEAAATVAHLNDKDVAARTMQRVRLGVAALVVGTQLLVYALSALALVRRWGGTSARPRLFAVIRCTALVSAATPVTTFLVQLVPWWRTGYPMFTVAAAAVAVAAAIAAAARAGPWRHRPLGPVTVVSAVTAVVLAADVMTGGQLQISSLAGYSPIVAGRYYGFGNTAFVWFGAAGLLVAAGLAEWQRRHGRRLVAVAAVVGVGLGVTVVDGWPGWGADFGGVLAVIPAFALLTLLTAEWRITLGRIVAVGTAAVVVVTTIACLDYLRPPAQRTHLGQFVAEVFAGEAASVLGRKLSTMLSTFGLPWLVLLFPALVVFVAALLLRPRRWRLRGLALACEREPMLRAGLLAILAMATLGTLVNDTGLLVLALALALAAPLAVTAAIHAVELDAAPGGAGSGTGGTARERSSGSSAGRGAVS